MRAGASQLAWLAEPALKDARLLSGFALRYVTSCIASSLSPKYRLSQPALKVAIALPISKVRQRRGRSRNELGIKMHTHSAQWNGFASTFDTAAGAAKITKHQLPVTRLTDDQAASMRKISSAAKVVDLAEWAHAHGKGEGRPSIELAERLAIMNLVSRSISKQVALPPSLRRAS